MRQMIKKNNTEVMKGFVSTEWTYFVTLTNADSDPSAGSVFMRLIDNLTRWKKIDPDLDYCLWICAHGEEDATGGSPFLRGTTPSRPHIHGTIRTTASRRQLERIHKGGFARLIPFKAPLVMSLYDYIQQQAIAAEPITRGTMEGIL